jgi:hypothetical protein
MRTVKIARLEGKSPSFDKRAYQSKSFSYGNGFEIFLGFFPSL